VKSVIEIIQRENLVENAKSKGDYFLTRLRDLEADYEILWGARGQGLMLGFELVKNKKGREPNIDILVPFVLLCNRRGVHLTSCIFNSVIRILPPITISQEEIDFAIRVIDEVLKEVTEKKINLADLIPKNNVSSRIYKKSGARLRRTWETSPEYWFSKMRKSVL
jgi:4-aminobutyrate aminotransferase-like enzyme